MEGGGEKSIEYELCLCVHLKNFCSLFSMYSLLLLYVGHVVGRLAVAKLNNSICSSSLPNFNL